MSETSKIEGLAAGSGRPAPFWARSLQFSLPRWVTAVAGRHPHLAPILGLGVFAIVYFLAFKYAVDPNNPTPSPFWFPNCLLLCALLRSPRKYWWIILLITIPIRLADNVIPLHPLWYRGCMGGLSIAQAYAGALVFQRIAPHFDRFRSWRDWIALFAVVLVAAPAAALMAGLRLGLGQEYWHTFQLAFAGDALALLVATPALLTVLFCKDHSIAALSIKRAIEASVLFIALLATNYMVFVSTNPLVHFPESRFFLPFPLLYWAALRFGMAGASIAVLIVTVFTLNSPALQHAIGILQQTLTPDARHRTPAALLLRFMLFRAAPVYLVAGLVERQRKAQGQLQGNERLLQTMIEYAPAAVAMFDTEMRYIAYSRRWLTDYRLGDRDLKGLSHYDVFPEISEAWRAKHKRILAGSHEAHDGEPFLRSDGTEDIIRWDVQPWFRGNGEIGGVAMFTEVITDRVRGEENQKQLRDQLLEAQKFEALGTLAGGIAHDFNNVLAMIGTNAELGLAEAVNEKSVRTSFGEIVSATARARDIVRQILFFSRKQATVFETISLAPIVEEAVSFLHATVPTNVEIRKSLGLRIPPVRANASQIYQILMNLGTNSAYAMPMGGVLSIGLDTLDLTDADTARSPDFHAGRYVRLSVQDNGTGMDRETLARIFEPFFTTKGAEGSGLGLSVVHGIVKAHGGAVVAESAPGQGTTIQVYFPAVRGKPASAPPNEEEPASGKGQHILYIDDEEAVSSAMKRLLVWLGYRCTAISDPRAALEAFRSNPGQFDAVISDVVMPNLSGMDIAREFHAIRPDMPIALTSGKIGWDVDLASGCEGVRTWLSKPATIAEIKGALAILFQESERKSPAE